MAYSIEADSTPLAEALSKIAQIIDQSESDPELMVAMLNQIEGACLDGRNGWFANVIKAQREGR